MLSCSQDGGRPRHGTAVDGRLGTTTCPRTCGTLFEADRLLPARLPACLLVCLQRYRRAMVGNIVVRALTIAFEPRYMPRLLCGRCESRLPTYQHWSSRRCSAAPEEACCQMLGEKRSSWKHNRAGLVLAMAIASSHTSNSHARVCLALGHEGLEGASWHRQAQRHPCQPCRAAVIRLV